MNRSPCFNDWHMGSSKSTKKIFESVASLKLGFRRDEAASALGSVQLLDDLWRAGWIEPVVNRHKLVLFDRGDIQRAWARVLTGEMPPMRDRRSKNKISKNAGTATSVAKAPAPLVPSLRLPEFPPATDLAGGIVQASQTNKPTTKSNHET